MAQGPRVLVYGYGNPGRGDDGLGAALVERVESHYGDTIGTDCNYQLNAEDALTISEYDIVVFADASREDEFGGAALRPLLPEAEVSFTTHAMSPGSVLALCKELYGRQPDTYMLAMKGYRWEMGEGLSTQAEESLAQALSLLDPLLNQPSRKTFAAAATQPQT